MLKTQIVRRPRPSLGLGGAAPGITFSWRHLWPNGGSWKLPDGPPFAVFLATSLATWCFYGVSNLPASFCTASKSPLRFHLCTPLFPRSWPCLLPKLLQLPPFAFSWPRLLPNGVSMAVRNCRFATWCFFGVSRLPNSIFLQGVPSSLCALPFAAPHFVAKMVFHAVSKLAGGTFLHGFKNPPALLPSSRPFLRQASCRPYNAAVPI